MSRVLHATRKRTSKKKLLCQDLEIEEIHQKFLETGHTYLPCDKDFGIIEKTLPERIFLPEEYIAHFKTCKVKEPRFKVKEMKQFHDVHALSTANVNRKKRVDGVVLKFKEVRWFVYKKAEPGIVYVQYDSWTPDQPMKKWDVRKADGTCGSNLSVKDVTGRKIKEAKKKDLMKLIKKGLIRDDAKSFYESLQSKPADNSDDEVDAD